MATSVVKVKVKHVFDVRNEISVRDLKSKRISQPVRCLRCKKLVDDPSSSCSAQR